jgi:hypothetical protein
VLLFGINCIEINQSQSNNIFMFIIIEEIRLVSLLLLTVVSNTFAKFELGCLRLDQRVVIFLWLGCKLTETHYHYEANMMELIEFQNIN